MDIKPRSANDVVGRTPQQRTQSAAGGKFRKQNKLRWVVAAVIVILLIAGGVWCYMARGGSQIDGSKYQAVFLNNNQVYFGKLHNYGTNQPYLTNVWYIQSPTGTSDTTKVPSSQQLQLTQLTKAVHGPEDEMILNKSNILFVENLSSNSQVVKLINGDK